MIPGKLLLFVLMLSSWTLRGFPPGAPVIGKRTTIQAVLILSYHQIRHWRTGDSKNARTYIVPPDAFSQQMSILKDAGYHSILPDQLVDHLTNGTPLPAKPVMITFDDGTAGQYDNALPILTQYNFKAVFFIMTVTLDRKNFLSKEQVRFLSERGHVIGCHTWDHHDVRKYKDGDWDIQLTKPKALLEKITGKAVEYFAYPYGSWHEAVVEQLSARHYKGAFQLSDKRQSSMPLFTLRRTIVDGHWSEHQFKAFLEQYRY